MVAQPQPSSAPTPAPAADATFAFVQELARELSDGKVELPGFPDVAMRVQRALSDPNVTGDKLLRIVSAEPLLAARIMQMANSAALSRSAAPVAELRTAINRLGFDLLRSAAVAYAMEQVRRAPELKALAKPLAALWQRSVSVAATSFGFAARYTQVNPDTAMLAGLLHSVGRLYLLVRAGRHPALLADAAGWQGIVRDWHANIARALLENWQVADDIVQAVGECEDLERDHRGGCDLTDVLTAGALLVANRGNPLLLDAQLRSVHAFTRVSLKSEDCEALLRDTDTDLAALRSALGG